MQMLNPWAILGTIIISLGIAWISYNKGNEDGQAKIQQQWDQEKADMLAKHAEEVEKAREKERGWQQAVDKTRQEKDREIKNLNARATALSNSLRQRPSVPAADAGSASEAPSAGQVAAGCTGAELYREHAEAFAREAARADEIRLSLKQCYGQYDAVSGVLQSSK